MIYKLTYKEKTLKGKIRLSGSKSESNRILIINHLSGNSISTENLSDSEDTKTLQKLLFDFTFEKQFDVGHAGTCMRFLTSLFSITPGERILKGSDRMHERPIRELVDALRQLGAEIEYLEKDGFPPLKISGKKLEGNAVSIKGDVSSQYITSLMMIAPYLENGLQINISGELVSKPYVQMTASVMQYFGANVNVNDSEIKISKGEYLHKTYKVESDWSSASYWCEAASFCENVDLEIEGVKFDKSLQADSVIKSIFSELGIVTSQVENGIRLTSSGQSKTGIESYDFSDCPDIAQTLACTSIAFQNEFKLTGLKTLRIKETDRVEALFLELNKIGFHSVSTRDSLTLNSSELCEDDLLPVSTYHDHRMAMSFAMLVFYFGEIQIENPKVVSKSYPDFWNHLASVGVIIEEVGKQ